MYSCALPVPGTVLVVRQSDYDFFPLFGVGLLDSYWWISTMDGTPNQYSSRVHVHASTCTRTMSYCVPGRY